MYAVGGFQGLDHRHDRLTISCRNQEGRQQFIALIPIAGQVDAIFLVLMFAEVQLAPVVNGEGKLGVVGLQAVLGVIP